MNYYWTNYHSHCNLCDGRAPMSDFVQKAVAMKLHSYGISSHGPLPFETKWNMLEKNLPEYLRQFQELKIKHGHEINLFCGLEIDYIHGITDVNVPVLKSLPLDYRIGSVHYMGQLDNGTPWTVDGAWDCFNQGVREQFEGNYKKAVLHFFQATKEMIALGGFDIIGHFDKISVQNQEHACFSEQEKWYQREIQEVLHLCKEQGIIVEINTKSITRKSIYFPDRQHWPLMLEEGNAIIVNSDCHDPDLITMGFNKIYHQLVEAGFQEVSMLEEAGWALKPISNKGILMDQ